MKRKPQIILGIIFLAPFLFLMLVLIKPGASYFYKKSTIQPQNIIRAGNAYEYHFQVNTQIYDPNSVLVLEDQKVLGLNSHEYTEAGQKGSFALKDISADQITVLFVPSIPADPTASGHSYNIYIRPYFISTDWAWNGLLILLLLVIFTFIWPGLVQPGKLKAIVGWPAAVIGELRSAAARPKSFSLPPKLLIIQSAVNIILTAYLYIFMEWLFFVTKPSFMGLLDMWEKVKILLMTGLAACILALLTLLVMFLIDVVLTPFFPPFRRYVYHLPAAFLGACLCLILVDNFTYTVFNFGIVDSRLVIRGFYALAFVAVFVYLLRQMAGAAKPDLKHGSFRVNAMGAALLLVVSCILAGFTFKPLGGSSIFGGQKAGLTNQPNIILFNTDGVNANNMSVYGYGRDTTPFITQLAKSSLISENNFTNAYVSEGSETATLTGKIPFATNVLNSPDTLQGVAEFQSLPRLLKANGYRTVSLGVPVYVDVNAINFKYAFDAVNCKPNPPDNPLSAYNYDNEIYMLSSVEGRIGDRLKHIFFIQQMQNPFTMATQSGSEEVSDEQRIDCLHAYLEDASQTGQPLFAHIHLMGTHGKYFYPPQPVFSKGEVQNKGWMTDFYDDSILNFDTQVQSLVQYLKDHGQWNNTILILYTDHGQMWVVKNRLPLIIHFPNDKHAGAITTNTQNIDIAPTLLDYLGMQIPAWMEGNSLLGNLDAARLIIAQFGGQASVIQCQNRYLFDLKDRKVTQGLVQSYVSPCAPGTLDSQDAIRGKIGQILKQLGYTPPKW
ncbi:MAG: sulfatase-like hydrolase/transferase [Anaerolineaceae bacterium]|nr:sulfatase-like hydrolase/transferase [Anaerolineaceae bacterium]